MKWLVVAAIVVMFTSVTSQAADTFDKARALNMSILELDAAADALRSQKDFTGAIRYMEVAVRKQPKNATLVNKLGVLELQVRDYGGAASHFRKAIKLNPKYADALNNLGATYFLQNDSDKAARYYRKALALEETRATFHVNLAAVWERQDRLSLALAEYARALELDPEVLTTKSSGGAVAQLLTPEQRASRFFLLARVCAIRGDIEGSLDYLKKAKEEGYRDMKSVYKRQEFQKLWQDARLIELIPPNR